MRIFILLWGLVLAGHALGQTSDRLLAQFSFKGCKATDESGNGSSAALVGDTVCACGVTDTAFFFNDRKTSMLLIGPLLETFSTGDFTISFYFKPKPTALGGAQVIMAKQENCSNRRAFWVRYNPISGKISSAISENDTLSSIVTASLDKGRCWQYVTLVRNNTKYAIYINGKLRDTKTAVARLDLSSTIPFKVGEPICPLDRGMIGYIDELRFYSKAFTVDDVARFNLHPDQILTGDTLVYLGSSMNTRTSQSCATSYSWTPREGVSDPMAAQSQITPTSTTTYYLNFQHADGCIARDSVVVEVIDPNTLDCNTIFVPNAFTPGGTPGRNDRFGISNPFAVQDFISFEVYDRWGGRVFNAVDRFDTWDGVFQGQFANPGMFLYRLRYRCSGIEKVKSGNLVLLR